MQFRDWFLWSRKSSTEKYWMPLTNIQLLGIWNYAMHLYFCFCLFMFDAIKVSVTSIEWQICAVLVICNHQFCQRNNKIIEKKTSLAIPSIVKAIWFEIKDLFIFNLPSAQIFTFIDFVSHDHIKPQIKEQLLFLH